MTPLGLLLKNKTTLKNGTKVWIRPIEVADTPYLIDIYENLSSESRYNRFQHIADGLSDNVVESRAAQTALDSVDNGFGLLAFADLGNHAATAIGGARYYTDLTDPYSAEIAMTIRDDMQGQGLGKLLLKKLIKEARQRGLLYFTGVALPENSAIWHLLASTGLSLTCWDEEPDRHFRMML